jgi:hypothetical protein
MTLFNMLYRNFKEGADKNQEKRLVYLLSELRFKPGTSGIQVKKRYNLSPIAR